MNFCKQASKYAWINGTISRYLLFLTNAKFSFSQVPNLTDFLHNGNHSIFPRNVAENIYHFICRATVSSNSSMYDFERAVTWTGQRRTDDNSPTDLIMLVYCTCQQY